MEKIGGVTYKIIGGKRYSFGGRAKTKSEANKAAERLRSMGASARVIPVKNGYDVWGRKK